MPSLAFRKASICSRFSFSASCTLVVNPQHATCSRLILYWNRPPPSGSSCIGKDYHVRTCPISNTLKCALTGVTGGYVVLRFLQDSAYVTQHTRVVVDHHHRS